MTVLYAVGAEKGLLKPTLCPGDHYSFGLHDVANMYVYDVCA